MACLHQEFASTAETSPGSNNDHHQVIKEWGDSFDDRNRQKGERLTVDDGNISVLVVLWERDRGPGYGGHGPDGPPVVGAVEMARSGARLVASADPSASTLQPASAQASAQAVGEAERVPRAVPAVRLVDPLHHSGLSGNTGVVARQNHWLEQSSVPLLISHHHMEAWAWRRDDTCKGRKNI